MAEKEEEINELRNAIASMLTDQFSAKEDFESEEGGSAPAREDSATNLVSDMSSMEISDGENMSDIPTNSGLNLFANNEYKTVQDTVLISPPSGQSVSSPLVQNLRRRHKISNDVEKGGDGFGYGKLVDLNIYPDTFKSK